MWTALLLLLPVVVIVVFVWAYRRQAAARGAASAERMKAFLESHSATAKHPTGAPAATPDAARAESSARSAPLVRAAPKAHAPLMNPQLIAFYRGLKTALPEHEVFPRVSLSTFLQPAGNLSGLAQEAQMRRFAQTTIDFLICDRTMQPVAAICHESLGLAATVTFARECVEGDGLRFVTLIDTAVPAPELLRTRVLGA